MALRSWIEFIWIKYHYNKLNVSDSSVRLIAQGNYPVALKNILAQNCKKLRSVDLEVSQLKKVNLNGTNGLRVLKLNYSGSIKKLNVSKMKNLRELRVGGSKITTLSVKKKKSWKSWILVTAKYPRWIFLLIKN